LITVWRGELCSAPAEGILRPVSSEGAPVTGAARRLEARAGPAIASRLEELGEVPVGGAVITPAGDLPASFVIHVVVQSADESVSPAVLERALVNGLRRAAEWGVESLALPPVGLGPGTMDPEEAARILVAVLRQHLELGAEPRDLSIVVESDFEEKLYKRLVAVTDRSDGRGG
jgi:O-acetyl-ADP-ribose deacetylase (regulator of RNase III)